ncbi:multicopper oxidase domain-containing protein [Salirhabdus salicampi]|uniref:multicopper oxidase domain-containing protein n=1 Tax=Salirhabdus salicampi TaxID=476102 RepID=UPI0020C250A7|nr:multicopper oxidase domain-containing protein [Salirhabdus salicampi]MCP8615273.1 multicopper oxidase domain-containing protein [Salirhabdus salicampi]
MIREYHVVAIPLRIVYNQYGDHDPDGKIFTLKENVDKIKQLVKQNPHTPIELVQPLTIRANVGDEVVIYFENQLNEYASMHFQDVEYDVVKTDGAFVGSNPNTTVPPKGHITYQFTVDHEGICYFSDMGDVSSEQGSSNRSGLWGALIVEQRGSTWTDPETGEPLKSGVYADIHNPLKPSFREYVWFFNDEAIIKDLTGNTPIHPHTGEEDESLHAVNYRSEPMRNRLKLMEEGVVCPGCVGEEVHHDSWAFGDPSTPILRGYKGDPVKIRLINGGVKETHVFHYHVHQWLKDPNEIDSEIIDAQSVGPQSHYTIEPLYGLGSLPKAIGDSIIHCHLYPHFGVGMWGISRVFDTLQDGSQTYPDGTTIKALKPLPDRPIPPKPTKEKPGFPNFIPGKVGYKAPRPPLSIVGGRDMTELEKNASIQNARPGAIFTDASLGNPVVKEFNISAIEIPIIYNNEEWYDPYGRIYVLDEEIDDIKAGRKPIEPLVLHAEAGSCIRINFTNRLPEVLQGSPFQLSNRTYECGVHVHFVKFDGLVSDGANVGWNYDSSVLQGETIRYEWYADVELKAVFYHDHLFASSHQQHGMFGGAIIHPRFSTFLSSETGSEVNCGTQITVTNPILPDYRDFTLFAQDFTMLYDNNDNPIEPPPFPDSQDDPGVSAINYRNAPLPFRIGPGDEVAYSFSSFVHGDPETPILRTYEGDSIRIRLIQGSHEESHSFNMHGIRWKREQRDLNSPFVSQQHTGISESFTLETYVPRSGDYLYAFETIEDIWLGAWGLIRAYEEKVDNLIPLPNRSEQSKKQETSPEQTGSPPNKAQLNSTLFSGSKLKQYNISAIQAPIQYNENGDYDPDGIIFVLDEKVEKISSGEVNPEPLVIRANVGDLVEVTLTNRLNANTLHKPKNKNTHHYPSIKLNNFYHPSLRISLHPQLVQYDVKSSSGETVGFNPDQTIAPGETITYQWYIDDYVGAVNLWDMADVRHHKHHGAFGTLIVEPRGSAYLDPATLHPTKSTTNAVITNPFLPTFREHVLIMHDGIRLLDNNNNEIRDPIIDNGEEADTYDQGSKGFNYRSERLFNRAENIHDHKIFSLSHYGDPATPMLEAYKGDPVVIRLLMPSERRRTHTFHLHGHRWRLNPNNMNSAYSSVHGLNTVGSKLDAYIEGGAGGKFKHPGDYMYRAGNIMWSLESGMWGLLRVHDQINNKNVKPLSDL